MKTKWIPTFQDATSWDNKRFYQTKGTRNKSIVMDPDTGRNFYFKTSFLRGERDYKYEFWSEIIASYVGKYLEFNVLEYNIARKGDQVGCLSKEMNNNNSSLFEGLSILTSVNETYKANKTNSYKDYTLENIYNALDYYKIDKNSFNDMLFFDFIIGNRDRHHENWGFISYTKTDFTHEFIVGIRKIRILKKLITYLLPPKLKSAVSNKFLSTQLFNDFAPIYDNGSSLGRELFDNRIDENLKNDLMFNGFINRCETEIRNNNGHKFKQIEIIENIIIRDPDSLKRIQAKLMNSKDSDLINIINNIDLNLPDTLFNFKLPKNRKEFIFRVISERIKTIKAL